jgi:hypothetical protein
MVRGWTNTLLARVSGNSTTVPVLITACVVRSTRPRAVHAHDRHSAKASSSPIAASVPGAPPGGRYPMTTPRTVTRPAAIR